LSRLLCRFFLGSLLRSLLLSRLLLWRFARWSRSATSATGWRSGFRFLHWPRLFHHATWSFGFFLFFFLFVIFVERVAEATGVTEFIRFIVTHVEGLFEIEIHLASSVIPDAAAPVCAFTRAGKLKRQN